MTGDGQGCEWQCATLEFTPLQPQLPQTFIYCFIGNDKKNILPLKKQEAEEGVEGSCWNISHLRRDEQLLHCSHNSPTLWQVTTGSKALFAQIWGI